jgi:hypothetical protein
MHRARGLLVLALLLIPTVSRAIQLHWGSGADTLTFTEPTRAILVLRADSAEVTLPPEWRLLWVGDSTEVQVVELDSLEVCEGDTARVYDVDGPETPADSTAHLVTAHFCLGGSEAAEQALYELDLPAWGRGKCKVVALDLADSASVLESNEVTFNGGTDASYPTAVLYAASVHQSTEFRVSIVGTGLGQASGVALAALDGSWRQPLEIANQDGSAINAVGSFAASVPTCVVEVEEPDRTVATVTLAADPAPASLELSCPSTGDSYKMREVWSDHDPYLIQPKDFAFVPGGWTPAGSWAFHLFYIRQNQYIKVHAGSDYTEKNIGHAVSDSLENWTVVDTAAIRTRGGRWDSLHVWAPNIVLRGLTYHMFYTGVDGNGNQRIGLATSTDLVTWVQGDSVLEVTDATQGNIPWADPSPDSVYGHKAQLRDAYVMQDPDVPGDWLMFFTTISRDSTPNALLGVARSDGDFKVWGETVPLWNSYHRWRNDMHYITESPHAFYRDGNWWLFHTINGDTVWAESNAYSPADTVNGGARWSQPQKIWQLVPPLQAANLYYWHSTEYLRIGTVNDIEYLAAWNDAEVCIEITQMQPSPPYLFKMCEPSIAAVDDQAASANGPRLLLCGSRPVRAQVGLAVELQERTPVRLAVYDIMGRRVRTLANGELPAGRTEFQWDGRDQSGAIVGSGVYFASLNGAGVRCSVRVPVIR